MIGGQRSRARFMLESIARLVIYAAAVGASVAAGLYLIGMTVGVLPNPWTCLTVARQSVAGPAGITFETIYSNCDLIAKWERVAIYVRRPGEVRKMLLFEYDPDYGEPLPSIAFPNEKQILISVPEISSVVAQRDRWNGHSISYRIGRIDYPDAHPEVLENVMRNTLRSIKAPQ